MFNFVKIVQHDQRYILKKIIFFMSCSDGWCYKAVILPFFSNFTGKLPKKGLDKKLLKNCKMTAVDEVIRLQQGIIWKRGFLGNIFLVKLNNFFHEKHMSLKGLKWIISCKITEKGKMTTIWRHQSITSYEEFFFKMYLSSCWTIFTMINIA